jgi:hypothetical protein
MIQIVGDLGGMTLGPGTYEAAAAISLTGALTLDAGNDSGAKWDFKINAAFSTAADSTIVLINEVLPANVDWNVNGAVTAGAGSTLVGNIVAVGAVVLGADTLVDGTLESTGGAVTLGAGSTATGAIKAKGAVALGAGAVVIGDIYSGGAVTLGAGSSGTGSIKAGGAVSLGTDSTIDGPIVSDGAISLGVSAQSGPVTSTTGAAISVSADAVALVSYAPSESPSAIPSASPSLIPSSSPSRSPSSLPSGAPSSAPSSAPSASPSASPSAGPSSLPSLGPSAAPSAGPSASPSTKPSASPSAEPSSLPSSEPSASPSGGPSASPSTAPSATPSAGPSASPSTKPSASPSAEPSYLPSSEPSASPIPGFKVRQFNIVSDDGAADYNIGSTTEARALNRIVRGTGPAGESYTVDHYFEGVVTRVNMGGANGDFNPTDSYPDPAFPGGDNFLVSVSAKLTIPPGRWTMGTAGGEGRILIMNGIRFNENVRSSIDGGGLGTTFIGYEGGTAQHFSRATFTVSEETTVNLHAMFWQHEGRGNFELLFAEGWKEEMTDFQILGDGVHRWVVDSGLP